MSLPAERLVSAKPSPKANPMDVLFHSVWFRLIYLLSFAIYTTVLWFVLGPASKVAEATTPWYAVSVACGTLGLVVAVPALAVVRRVPRQWFRVPARERLLHRMLGVGVFGWLLDVSRWNPQVLEPLRGFSGKRAGLFSLEQSVRAAAVSHGICFAIHILLAVLALFSRRPWSAALWILLPGVVVHLSRCCYSAPSCLDSSLCSIRRVPADWAGRASQELFRGRVLGDHSREEPNERAVAIR